MSDDLSRDPDTDAFDALRARWRAEGRLGSRDGLVLGGYRRLWLDAPGRLLLYANQQGGYYVRCPETGGNIATAFTFAVESWRHGGARSMECPRCGQTHALEAVTLSPPGAFARGAVVFTDVGSLTLAEGVREQLRDVLGESREVIRRVG